MNGLTVRRAAALAGGCALFASLAGCGGGVSNGANSAANSSSNGAAAAGGGWQYTSSTDAMTSAKTTVACVESDNQVTLQFPYKDTKAQLCVRQNGKTLDSYVQLDGNGQILCDFGGCSVRVKFDDAQPKSFPATRAADNSTNIIFLEHTAQLIASLKKSSKAMVELSYFQNGDQTLTFSTAGLKWGAGAS
ncbi:MAG TPA: hypothetical protein VGG29_08355 [Caulobacteraceae bacterium]|jgi:hypothetical protein